MGKALIGLAMTLVALSGGCRDQADSSSSPNKIVINLAHHMPIGTLSATMGQRFKQAIESQSDGSVEVRLYPASQIGNERENIESVQLGSLEMSIVDPGYLSNLLPEMAVMELPFMFANYDHVETVCDGQVNQIFNRDLIESQGLRILGWGHGGFRSVVCNRPIRSLAEFRGLKLRVPEIPQYVAAFQAIGAVPTPIAFGEIYMALKTRVVDGMENPPEALYTARMYEVTKYIIHTEHINNVAGLIISEDFYQKLPPDIRELIQHVANEVIAWQRGEAKRLNAEYFQKLQDEGMQLISIDTEPLRQVCLPLRNELVKKYPKVAELVRIIDSLKPPIAAEN